MNREPQQPTLHVRILSPDKTIWEGEAISISSENQDGPFDVLPHHANFITVATNASVVIKTPNEETKKYSFERFAMYVHQNTVSIYAEV